MIKSKIYLVLFTTILSVWSSCYTIRFTSCCDKSICLVSMADKINESSCTDMFWFSNDFKKLFTSLMFVEFIFSMFEIVLPFFRS